MCKFSNTFETFGVLNIMRIAELFAVIKAERSRLKFSESCKESHHHLASHDSSPSLGGEGPIRFEGNATSSAASTIPAVNGIKRAKLRSDPQILAHSTGSRFERSTLM